jgi:hypothetical protein
VENPFAGLHHIDFRLPVLPAFLIQLVLVGMIAVARNLALVIT